MMNMLMQLEFEVFNGSTRVYLERFEANLLNVAIGYSPVRGALIHDILPPEEANERCPGYVPIVMPPELDPNYNATEGEIANNERQYQKYLQVQNSIHMFKIFIINHLSEHVQTRIDLNQGVSVYAMSNAQILAALRQEFGVGTLTSSDLSVANRELQVPFNLNMDMMGHFASFCSIFRFFHRAGQAYCEGLQYHFMRQSLWACQELQEYIVAFEGISVVAGEQRTQFARLWGFMISHCNHLKSHAQQTNGNQGHIKKNVLTSSRKQRNAW
jgi:hypothetical protein